MTFSSRVEKILKREIHINFTTNFKTALSRRVQCEFGRSKDTRRMSVKSYENVDAFSYQESISLRDPAKKPMIILLFITSRRSPYQGVPLVAANSSMPFFITSSPPVRKDITYAVASHHRRSSHSTNNSNLSGVESVIHILRAAQRQ
jgi:hypothetical protein